MQRQQQITFGEMRESGVFGVLVCCGDYHCSHSTTLPADRWPDQVRLSDIEPQSFARFVASAAPDVRPNFPYARMGR